MAEVLFPDDRPLFCLFSYAIGYVYGNPRNWPFDGWIEQSPNVIIVFVYYRLGFFGFLATQEFSDPTYGDFNAGFSDQIQALESYIGKFGGDPTKVTINGQSAGASPMIADERAQLFSGAITQRIQDAPTPNQQHVFKRLSVTPELALNLRAPIAPVPILCLTRRVRNWLNNTENDVPS